MTRVVLDEMYPAVLAAKLRKPGLDVVAVLEIEGLSDSSDLDLLEWATRHERAVVTENVGDFARLSHGAHRGIILVRARKWPRSGPGMGRLEAALDARLWTDMPVSTGAAEWL